MIPTPHLLYYALCVIGNINRASFHAAKLDLSFLIVLSFSIHSLIENISGKFRKKIVRKLLFLKNHV